MVFSLSHKSPAMIDLILVEHELGASTAGSSQGPSMVLGNLVKLFPVFKKARTSRITPCMANAETPHAKNLISTLETMKEVRNKTIDSFRDDRFPVILSGDHSTAVGTVAGIKRAFPSLRIGAVWFDAHTDIHSPMTSHSSNLHGMPMSAITAQANLENRRQSISDHETILWSQTVKLGGAVPMIDIKDVVYVGIRDVEKEEQALVEKAGCLLLKAKVIISQPADQIAAEIQAHLKDCDVIYVSFDIDCIDESQVPGTGTPVSEGPTPEKIFEIMTELSRWDRVVCFEMSEVNPSLDQNGKTSAIAAKIIHHLLQGM